MAALVVGARRGCSFHQASSRQSTLLLYATRALEPDPDRLARRRLDAAVREHVGPRVHARKIEWHTQLLWIVWTAAFRTELQPARAGRIDAPARVKLALA